MGNEADVVPGSVATGIVASGTGATPGVGEVRVPTRDGVGVFDVSGALTGPGARLPVVSGCCSGRDATGCFAEGGVSEVAADGAVAAVVAVDEPGTGTEADGALSSLPRGDCVAG